MSRLREQYPELYEEGVRWSRRFELSNQQLDRDYTRKGVLKFLALDGVLLITGGVMGGPYGLLTVGVIVIAAETTRVVKDTTKRLRNNIAIWRQR